MPGGLLQIVAYGAQDMYLTYNPQITFFKIVYRRYTNFSIQSFEYSILDNPNFGLRSIYELDRTGDLITKSFLKIVIPSIVPNGNSKFAWIRRLGHAILDMIEIKIGGQLIDRQYGSWLDVWFELAHYVELDRGYQKLIGDVPELTSLDNNVKPQYTLYIPLKYWFCRHVGLALPIIAIQYHQIEFNMIFNSALSLGIYDSLFDVDILNTASIVSASLLIDNVYLDEEERRLFATIGHEYLIEQVQYTGVDSMVTERTQLDLQFNHPTKELIWFMKRGIYTIGELFLAYTNEFDNDWSDILVDVAITILSDSIVLLEPAVYEIDNYGNRTIISPGESLPNDGSWEEFETGSSRYTLNGHILIVNNSNKSFWINTDSLLLGASYSITNKIFGKIFIGLDESITITEVKTEITIRDISFPISSMIDTRNTSNDIVVRQFHNYGVLIDGSFNPVALSKLEYNRQERFDKRNGKFFNYLQTEMHHSRIPTDGINVYSFALKPEEHQPSGTSNLSRVEHQILTLYFKDTSLDGYDLNDIDEPIINILSPDNRAYVFGFSYNILRVNHGLAAIAYNG